MDGPEEDGSGEDGTLFIPKSEIEHDCKAGDTLRFEVVGEDEDDLEVKFAGYSPGKGDNMEDDLRKTFAGKDSTEGYE